MEVKWDVYSTVLLFLLPFASLWMGSSINPLPSLSLSNSPLLPAPHAPYTLKIYPTPLPVPYLSTWCSPHYSLSLSHTIFLILPLISFWCSPFRTPESTSLISHHHSLNIHHYFSIPSLFTPGNSFFALFQILFSSPLYTPCLPSSHFPASCLLSLSSPLCVPYFFSPLYLPSLSPYSSLCALPTLHYSLLLSSLLIPPPPPPPHLPAAPMTSLTQTNRREFPLSLVYTPDVLVQVILQGKSSSKFRSFPVFRLRRSFRVTKVVNSRGQIMHSIPPNLAIQQ